MDATCKVDVYTPLSQSLCLPLFYIYTGLLREPHSYSGIHAMMRIVERFRVAKVV